MKIGVQTDSTQRDKSSPSKDLTSGAGGAFMLNWWMLAHCFAMSGTPIEALFNLLIKIRMIVGPAERGCSKRYDFPAGLGKLLQFSDGSLERINQQLLQRLGIKSRDSPVTELASSGHISAALQVTPLSRS